jgi:hypothetical protein
MTNFKIEIKWALIFAAMTLGWMLMERLVGLHSTHIDKHLLYSNLIAIPAITVYVFALLDKRKNYYQGKMTYQQGFMSGLVISLLVMILSPITQVITSLVIAPDYFANIIQHSVSTGKMTQTEAADYFNLKSYIIQGLAGAPVMGIVTSAIVAFFTKK